MSLTQTGLSVNKQGVISGTGLFRYFFRSGKGKLVGGTHHKPFKRVIGEIILSVLNGVFRLILIPFFGKQQSYVHIERKQIKQ